MFRFRRSFDFPVSETELWAILSRTQDYRSWWSWLRAFDVEGLVEGATARCSVRAPIPYTLQFEVFIERIVPAELVQTVVHGDISGPASLELHGAPDGCRATLMWDVEVRDRLLASAARVARPVMEWGHEWVVATGVRSFRRRLVSTSAEAWGTDPPEDRRQA